MSYYPKCSDCHKRMPSPGNCESCKQFRRTMHDVRRFQAQHDTPEKRAERERRIPLYASIKERGVELFS